jgi:hypothetical protein
MAAAVKKLRCVGGPNHGSVAELEDGQPRITLRKHQPIASIPDFRRGFASVGKTTIDTSYTVRKIATPEGPVEYLAPEGMSDFEALSRAFAP